MSELLAMEKELQELIQNLSKQIDIEPKDVDTLLPRLSK
jgi:predicted transcriptional regulator